MTFANDLYRDLYRGRLFEEAKRLAEQAGFQVAVEVKGQQVLSNEFRAGRITFKVNEVGVVESAKIG